MQQFIDTITPAPRQSSRYPDFQQTRDGESGIILAAVLILLGIVVALVLQAQVLAHFCLNLEKNRLTRTQLRETAGDGIWHALNKLAADQTLLIDHTNEEWAAPMFFQLPGGIDTEIRIIDENRFLDANMLAYVSPSEQWRPSAAIIRDLLAGESSPARNTIHRGEIAGGLAAYARAPTREPGQAFNPEMQTEIIRDWVDQNSEGGYEKAYYQRKQSQFYPDDLPMESREELFWLLAPTANNASQATALTILPGKERRIEPVNVNTASRQTLLAVFSLINAAVVERIIRGRDVAPLLTLDQILDPLTMRRYASYLSVRSSFFSVYAKSKMGFSTEEVYCLAKRDPAGNVQIIRWVEH